MRDNTEFACDIKVVLVVVWALDVVKVVAIIVVILTITIWLVAWRR